VVSAAANMVHYAKEGGAKVIEINTDDTPFTNLVDCALRGPAGELVPQLV
jgi:NAD-dependent SIR2 family protein deacetylase